jgi:flagellar basal body P-ring protein FlgI
MLSQNQISQKLMIDPLAIIHKKIRIKIKKHENKNHSFLRWKMKKMKNRFQLNKYNKLFLKKNRSIELNQCIWY